MIRVEKGLAEKLYRVNFHEQFPLFGSIINPFAYKHRETRSKEIETNKSTTGERRGFRRGPRNNTISRSNFVHVFPSQLRVIPRGIRARRLDASPMSLFTLLSWSFDGFRTRIWLVIFISHPRDSLRKILGGLW